MRLNLAEKNASCTFPPTTIMLRNHCINHSVLYVLLVCSVPVITFFFAIGFKLWGGGGPYAICMHLRWSTGYMSVQLTKVKLQGTELRLQNVSIDRHRERTLDMHS